MLFQIPYGTTETYLGLSKRLGNEKAIRAAAAANGANAISIFIPCHRIVGSKGEMIGYAGGIEAKKGLLRLEGSKNVNQLRLF
jgi:methylated-DNA-[protein]-cysteine S-methyltransferase